MWQRSRGTVGVAGETGAAAELRTYVRLEEQYRTIASLLRSTADAMAGARDLPMARHDVKTLAGADNREVFERFVGLEQELFALLQRSIEQDKATIAG